jgi:hypothetical protein
MWFQCYLITLVSTELKIMSAPLFHALISDEGPGVGQRYNIFTVRGLELSSKVFLNDLSPMTT